MLIISQNKQGTQKGKHIWEIKGDIFVSMQWNPPNVG